jgi:uncharacterized delta-60 repeat protein
MTNAQTIDVPPFVKNLHTDTEQKTGILFLDFAEEFGSVISQDYVSKPVLQADGKILLATNHGDNFIISRIDSDGKLDTSFGENGRTTINFGDRLMKSDLQVTNKGEIVVTVQTMKGYWDTQFVSRLNSTGEIDTSFSNDGIFERTLVFGENYEHFIIGNDGNIILIGKFTSIKELTGYTRLLKLDNNGVPLNKFGDNGIVDIRIPEAHSSIFPETEYSIGDVVVLPTDEIAIFGKIPYAGPYYGYSDNRIAQYLTVVKLDGSVVSNNNYGASYQSMRFATTLGDGNDLLIGGLDKVNNQDFYLIRGAIDSYGLPPRKFGLSTNSYPLSEFVDAIATDDGKVIVLIEKYGELGLIKLDEQLYPDTYFSSDGVTTIDLMTSSGLTYSIASTLGLGSNSRTSGIALQSDGKIVVSGLHRQMHYQDESLESLIDGREVFLVRFNADGSLDQNFGNTLNGTTASEPHIEGGDSVFLFSNDLLATLTFPDIDFDGVFLTVSRNGQPAQGDIFLSSNNLFDLTEGNSLFFSGSTIGFVKKNTDGILKIEFSELASEASISEILRSLQYQILDDAPPDNVGIRWAFLQTDSSGFQYEKNVIYDGLVNVQIIPTNDLPDNYTIFDVTPEIGSMLRVPLPGDIVNYDPDGPQFSISGNVEYAWFADDELIEDEATIYYVPTEQVSGKIISVKVSYIDAYGTEETFSITFDVPVSSNNSFPIGEVLLLGTALQGEELRVDPSGISDPDGLGDWSYQWMVDGVAISGAMASSYLLTQDEVGRSIRVKVSYIDGQGTLENVTSDATSVVTNMDDEAVGTLTVSGIAAEGRTLEASLTELSDLDGSVSLSWQWQISDTGENDWADIRYATDATHIIASDQSEVGKYLRVIATTTDALDGVTIFTGDASSQVANVNDVATGLVIITGTPTQGQLLTASNMLADADGLGTVAYQWLANGLVISSATASTYTLTQSDVGKAISVKAIYTDLLGTDESVTSAPTDDVQALAQFTDPIESIDAIGLTPDGLYLIIKSNGVSRMVSVDDVLEFSDETTSALELMNTLEPTPLFVSLVGGETEYVLPEPFTGPESLNLDYVLIDTTPNAVVIGSTLNDFIALQGGGNKATDGGLGDDVIDGGVGSTFISGGGGSNTFFLDGRADGVSWSTITDFTVDSDKATIWGWKPGVSQAVLMQELGGAEGYQGLTLHFENLLPSDAGSGETNSNWNSITFSGKSASDFGFDSLETLNAQILAGSNPNFFTGQTVDVYGTHGFLFIS